MVGPTYIGCIGIVMQRRRAHKTHGINWSCVRPCKTHRGTDSMMSIEVAALDAERMSAEAEYKRLFGQVFDGSEQKSNDPDLIEKLAQAEADQSHWHQIFWRVLKN